MFIYIFLLNSKNKNRFKKLALKLGFFLNLLFIIINM
nr:MAG TPA: hypothetical protein [Caudoviricetes sp.]